MKKHPGILLGTAVLLTVVFIFPSCTSFSLQQVDYGWPVESVLKVKENNTVSEGRYAISFNVAPLALREFEDSTALKGKEIRLLRSNEGMYYVTGVNFKNVYVMTPLASELKLRRRFEITPTGLKKPALNQREPYVELVDGNQIRVLMTSDEIYEEQDLRAEGR
ncbi:MAG: hypothetical protein HY961_12650 [Ignavibacteriae bacterium]|nr:hypothetical protein [Ignavibacteriota bacterium]